MTSVINPEEPADPQVDTKSFLDFKQKMIPDYKCPAPSDLGEKFEELIASALRRFFCFQLLNPAVRSDQFYRLFCSVPQFTYLLLEELFPGIFNLPRLSHHIATKRTSQ